MANNEKNNTIAISTIPIGKLSVVMNNFISNTINHLNKLSVKGDEKLAEFDKKLDDLEIMTTLLEAKLNSLPEKITSTYPPLEPCILEDIILKGSSQNYNVGVNEGNGSSIPPPDQPHSSETESEPEEKEKEKEKMDREQPIDEGGDNISPEDDLEKFLNDNPKFRDLYKMLKLGVPIAGVKMKAKMNGIDMAKTEELIDKAQKVNPNIS
jgi:hypothetical protein